MTDQEHYAYHLKLRDRVSVLRNTQRARSLIEKIDRFLPSAYKKREADLKRRYEQLCHCAEQLALKAHSTLYTHLVLDSVVQNEWPEEGLSQTISLAYLRKNLIDFTERLDKDHSSDLPLLIGLSEVLKDAIVYQKIILQIIKDKIKRFAFPHALLEELIMKRAEEMQENNGTKPPFLFLPLSNKDHGVIAVVTYSQEKKFSIHLVNTGDGAIINAAGKGLDLVHFGLEKEDLNALIRFALQEQVETMEKFMKNYRAAFASTSAGLCYGEPHGLQKGASCAVKSVVRSLHLVMPNHLLRAFKVFYSERLHKTIENSELKQLGEQIIAKRKLKASL
jgi:hypothetical protein